MDILGPLEHEWRHLRHPHASAEQAAAAVTINPDTPGGTVISVAEIEQDIRTVAAKFEQVDKAALGKLDAVQANPKTAEAFELIAAVAHVDPGPFFDSAVSVLRVLAGQAASVPVSAGPQVAGQA